MSLDTAPQGESMLVIRVAADGKTRRHLENLGIMSGAEVTPVARNDGNTIVRVHDSRIALNRETAISSVKCRISAIENFLACGSQLRTH